MHHGVTGLACECRNALGLHGLTPHILFTQGGAREVSLLDRYQASPIPPPLLTLPPHLSTLPPTHTLFTQGGAREVSLLDRDQASLGLRNLSLDAQAELARYPPLDLAALAQHCEAANRLQQQQVLALGGGGDGGGAAAAAAAGSRGGIVPPHVIRWLQAPAGQCQEGKARPYNNPSSPENSAFWSPWDDLFLIRLHQAMGKAQWKRKAELMGRAQPQSLTGRWNNGLYQQRPRVYFKLKV